MLCEPWETKFKLILRSPRNSDYVQTEQVQWFLKYLVVKWMDEGVGSNHVTGPSIIWYLSEWFLARISSEESSKHILV